MSMPALPPVNPGGPFSSLKANHVAVRVPDLDSAMQWYGETLDFRFVHA